MPLLMVSPPASEPVSLSEAKAHLRVIGADDDDYVSALIGAARMVVEHHCQRALISQDWALLLDEYPNVIELPLPPLQSVESVRYFDPDGIERSLSALDWQVSKRVPAILAPAPGKSWPATQAGKLDAVTITFTAGYGDAADAPAPLKHAILLLLAHWYENREPVITEYAHAPELPFTVSNLLAPYRVWSAV